ncbi:septum formation initiator family protein [Bifidobacterium actinocoloniiforme DSM 22766]|uniref:Septum formation initiator family protein n=1 Tax=Bifidobacterium actinocoloniiforme DSM 22766 TaxID=1437605 RepID=A0A086Z015_9BIFI|nr:septum formation initiator family protein [Bifidobacterium actinocoloniiforme]AKV55134.1 hypothetical protein AB656_01425 [Bifidobacterium actinocoloniiforme DSM 22766]KFI39865.1 septum formation initiator family protein [Bifidobacterium actinocoloniiforme DSM 22766]
MTKASLPRSQRASAGVSGSQDRKGGKRGRSPVSLCISLIIVFIGAIQLVSTFHTYAVNLSELNGLKNQQATLVAQKSQLENDIARWNDQAYVTAQARDRLGFVFPGEQAIRVLNPESVIGGKVPSAKSKSTSPSDKGQVRPPLPWYREMAYSLGKADASAQAKTQTQSQSDSGGQGRTSPGGASDSGREDQR